MTEDHAIQRGDGKNDGEDAHRDNTRVYLVFVGILGFDRGDAYGRHNERQDDGDGLNDDESQLHD